MDDYPDGVWLVELAPVADARMVPQAIASVLGVKEETGRPVLEALAAAVERPPAAGHSRQLRAPAAGVRGNERRAVASGRRDEDSRDQPRALARGGRNHLSAAGARGPRRRSSRSRRCRIGRVPGDPPVRRSRDGGAAPVSSDATRTRSPSPRSVIASTAFRSRSSSPRRACARSRCKASPSG